MDGSPQLEQLLGKIISDLGGAVIAPLVVLGDRLGLYKTLADIGPATPHQLAGATGTHERYIREWLAAQAASGYVTYDPTNGKFSLSPEQALVFADENSPLYMAGGFYSAAAVVNDEPNLTAAFRSGEGIPWGDHHECLFCGTAKFFRPSYAANLVQAWIPSLDQAESVLKRGGRIADVGCGHGCSTLIMAQAFPNSRVYGFDFHAPSVDAARRSAAEQGIENVQFEVGTAQDFPRLDGEAYDLVTIFDALHDMGDPVGAARQSLANLRPDGSWMVVEPMAGDRLEDNLHPIGRVYYGFSASVCVPAAVSQNGGHALGAQAGPAALEGVIRQAGFTRCRIATQSPFNIVLEARP